MRPRTLPRLASDLSAARPCRSERREATSCNSPHRIAAGCALPGTLARRLPPEIFAIVSAAERDAFATRPVSSAAGGFAVSRLYAGPPPPSPPPTTARSVAAEVAFEEAPLPEEEKS